MKKKIGTMISLALVLTMSLTGCGSKNDATTATTANENTSSTTAPSNKKVKIRIMAYNKEETRKTFLDLIKQSMPNVDLEYQFVDLKSYENLLRTQLASGEGPDLFETSGSGAVYANAGYVEDLTNAAFVSKYNDTGLMPYKGKIYTIPLQSWFEGIWYNKEIFAKNGISVPKTWDEWMAIQDKLRTAGIKPQAMGAKSWEPMMKQTMGLLLNEFYSKSENKGFDTAFSEGTKKVNGNWNEVVKKWTETIQKGNVTKDMLGIDYDQAQDEFATGKAAMWESGPWAAEALKKKNPNLQMGMFPIPGLKEGTGWLIGGPGSALAVNKNSKNKDTVMKILDLTSTPEAQNALIKDNFGSSFLKGVDAQLPPEYVDSAQAFKEGHVYAPWITWPFGNTVAEDYGKALQDVLAGGKSVDDALKVLDQKADDQRKDLSK